MVACAPWGAAGEFAASRHGVITRSQAAEYGISRTVLARLVRDQVLDEPVPGVLVVRGSPPTWRQRLLVAILEPKCQSAGTCGAAAALHGLDGYEPGSLDVLLPSGRRSRLEGVIHHRGPMGPEHARDFTIVDSIPCTGVARTLCDLGSVDSPDRVALAFECAWRRGYSLTWMRQTAERLHRPGQRGTGVLLRLLDQAHLASTPTASALEVRVEAALADIPGLVRQHTVFDSSGRFVARVDFAIPELKIAIEAHSRQFHFGEGHLELDARREEALNAEGWIVRFVTHALARDAAGLRSSVISLVSARSRGVRWT
jgi:very-short-patch-repair endonuclease